MNPRPQLDVTLKSVGTPAEAAEDLRARIVATDRHRHTLALDPSPGAEAVESMAKADVLEMTWEEDGDSSSTRVRVSEFDAAVGKLVVESVERRSHMRVDCSLMFRHRTLSESAYAEMAPRIVSQPLDYLEESADLSPAASDETWERLDNVLSNFHRLLREISDQVQHLIAVSEGRPGTKDLDELARVFTISGSGLGFESDRPLEVGTKLRLCFDLSGYPYRSVVCLGEVSRCDPSDEPGAGVPSHQIFAAFTHIREEDRDRIIRFVFKMQRRQLRHRRRQEAAL
jgi:hypothetical protein